MYMVCLRVKKHITIEESDVTIITDSDKFISIAIECLKKERQNLEVIIQEYPVFKTTFSPFYTKSLSELIIK